MPTRSGTQYHDAYAMNAEDDAAVAAEIAALEEGGGGGHALDAPGDVLDAVGQDPVVVAADSDVPPAQALGSAAVESGTTLGSIGHRAVNLPRDANKLSKFKGDTDANTVDDFLFQHDMCLGAQPNAYDITAEKLSHHE